MCFEGKLTNAQKKVKITGMPYPHFVSYHNLVASCNGATFEDKTLVNSHCCNNNRQERFVMPIYLSPDLVNGISYTSKGELDYDDSVYDCSWFDKKHLNLTNSWITLVRRIWCKISKSGYTDISIVIFNLLIVKSLENHAEIYLLILVLTQKLRVMTRICFIILEIK